MGLFDFLRKKSVFDADTFDTFYELLCNGADEEIALHIYRRDLLTLGEIRASVNAVTFHCRAPAKNNKLIEKERLLSSNGQFVLLIVVGSWVSDEEDNFVPLIVSLESRRLEIAGIVLPFDGLMMKCLGAAAFQIGELSATWVARKIAMNRLAEDDQPIKPEVE